VQIEYAVNDLNDLIDLEELVGGLCKFWSLTHYTLARGNFLGVYIGVYQPWYSVQFSNNCSNQSISLPNPSSITCE